MITGTRTIPTTPTPVPAPVAAPHVYDYTVRESHELLRAVANAEGFLATLPEYMKRFVAIHQSEVQQLPDAVLLIAACSEPSSPVSMLNTATATVELAARYRARTVHPIIASGDMELVHAWAKSPSVKAECLAALLKRRAELCTAEEVSHLPATAIN